MAIMEPNAYNFSSLMLALLRKPERGILHCKSRAFLNYFERAGMSYEIKLKYDGTFAPINLFAHLFRERGFVRTLWFNKLWERIDYVVNKITPKRFWSNIIILARK